MIGFHSGIRFATSAEQRIRHIASMTRLPTMPACSARATADDVDVFNVAQTLIGQSVVFETNGIVLDTGVTVSVTSLRLFHDLLEHEVLIAALFCCGHIPVDGLNFLFRLCRRIRS